VPIPISAGDGAAIAASAQKSVLDPVAGTAMTKELCPDVTDRISTPKRDHWYQIQAITGATGLAIAAIGFYRVRELVAALFIFTFLFGIVGIALMTLVFDSGASSQGSNPGCSALGLRSPEECCRIEPV
jgi:hypothetical protein